MAPRNEFKKEFGISSFWIRMIGVASMIWSFVSSSYKLPFHNSAIADCMMWFSYTIFAFLLAEGVNKTSRRLLYLRRMFVFAVISEVAYDLYKYDKFFDNRGQSVMLTLFICLCVMLICDYFKRRFRNIVLDIILIFALSVAAINLCTKLNSEFGKYGIMIGMLFYTSYDLTYSKTFEIIVMAAYSFYAKIDTIITVTINGLQYTVPIAVFAILALFVTWLYNEERGPNKIAVKIIFYVIYPAVLLAFYAIEKYL